MTTELIKLLLVEDNPGDAELIETVLSEVDSVAFSLTHVTYLCDGLYALKENNFDAILLDLSLPDSTGLDSILQIQAKAPTFPIVVLTGLNDQTLAITAVRDGAQDYLIKGEVNGQLLVRSIRYAIERKRAESAIRHALQQERELRDLKSRFVSMASHEFRTPLTTILAAASLLEKYRDRLLAVKQIELHKRIYNAAARMNHLLDDLLTIWRFDVIEETLRPSLLDLVTFSQNLVAEFELQSDRRICTLHFHSSDPSIPALITPILWKGEIFIGLFLLHRGGIFQHRDQEFALGLLR